ncbi:UbiA family prenyltransferase [Lentimicrobium sp.]|jgi:4-hydroxybenzoate polyprenyltransferase|uniref:geranylgeranylglycerol-phosphate geranylgeranyltransferase n=1 Tax=Lentimicrobium sp. TaxID=2034841 RepID=UPI002AB132C2|nr:UbiA family prenyltransferase [Lentimicrobium sp.]MCO5263509.1 geranylgeranylglycerol-phosphate geranylgeranyltransferase [Lentimicrobium sp.]HOP14673.1 geranylgeranylglycerol-phosphate geranylgeranyltransferase [Lentimicrobium sp.]HPF65799.1 geranylgeranylglycerol-phosphate geranylgeranyltransferase [Lentimicrobium sp.]HPJ61772.1 geranylgeranylglycerol-phosphate geranylgeranyltransferase [Lentimicrobium sp.]HPR27051.1 geranylgeranylglycerol-phosphate geranylgeranyltransferase [Lentimicrobi
MKIFTNMGALPFIRLIRWPNLIVVVLTQILLRYAIVGRVYAASGFSPAMDNFLFAVLIFTTVLIAAAGYIINDYFDIRTDVINHPDTVVLGKKIHRRKAIVYHIAMNVIALLGSVFLAWKAGSIKLAFVFIMIMVLLWLYSVRYKRTVLWGNLAVAFMSAMVVLVVWLFEFYMLRQQPEQFIALYGNMKMISRFFFVYALFAFLISLMREIVKDMEDVHGDQQTGCRTLPVVHGIRTAKLVTFIAGSITGALIIIAVIKLISSGMVLPALYFSAVVFIPLLFICYRIAMAADKADFHLISKLLKLLMLAGILGLQPLSVAL